MTPTGSAAPDGNRAQGDKTEARLEPLGSDGTDDVPAGADTEQLARARGDAGAEHGSFTVDPDDPRQDEGGNLMPGAEPL